MCNKGKADWSKVSREKMFNMTEKANKLIGGFQEAVIMMGAELFIINPTHEIFKGDYFDSNMKRFIIQRVREMLPLCKYREIIYIDKKGNNISHTPAKIEGIISNYDNKDKK